MRVLVALVLNGNDIALFYLKGRNIDLTTVHFDMAVIDELPALTARRREACPVDDVVQSPLEHEQKIFARDAFLAERFLEIIPKLFLEDKIDPLYFLLFPKLLAIARKHLSAGSSVLSRRIGPTLFDRT